MAGETTSLNKGQSVQYVEDDMESLYFEGEIGGEQKEVGKTIGIGPSSFNLANAVLGGGILSFPYAFSVTGVLGGVLATLVLLGFAYFAIIMLVVTADQFSPNKRLSSYQELVKVVYGNAVEAFMIGCIVLYGFGGCATFLVIIGDQAMPVVDNIIEAVGGTDEWYNSRKMVIFVLSWCLVFPVCLPKRLGVLSVVSLFAIIAVCYFTLMIIVYAFIGTEDNYNVDMPSIVNDFQGVKDQVVLFNWSAQFFQAAPIICFAYQCHLTSIAVYKELSNPTPARMGAVTFIALGLCGVLYTSAGLFGYLTFGTETQSDVLVNYSSDEIPVQICRVCMAVVAAFSYPILNFVTRLGCNDLIVRLASVAGMKIDNPEADKSNLRFYTITTIFFVGTLLIAMFVPNVNDIISIIGSIFATLFIFGFPGAFMVTMGLKKDTPNEKYVYIAIGALYLIFGFTVGAISFGISLYDDLYDFINQ